MEHIIKAFDDYIEKVTSFEHPYKETQKPYENLVCCWSDRGDFYKVILDILLFIEESSKLCNEYKNRVNYLKNVISKNNHELEKIENELYSLISKAWKFHIEKESVQEKEDAFFAEYEGTKEEYYTKKLRAIWGHNDLKNIDTITKFINFILDKNNYYSINANGFVKREIDIFLSQYNEMILPDTANKDENIKSIKKDYQKVCSKLHTFFEDSINLRADEFFIFDYFANNYKKSLVYQSNYTDAYSELDCASQSVDSVTLVYSTLEVLKAMKNFYLFGSNKLIKKQDKNKITKQEQRFLDLLEDNKQNGKLLICDIIKCCKIKTKVKAHNGKFEAEKKIAQNLVYKIRNKLQIPLDEYDDVEECYPISY